MQGSIGRACAVALLGAVLSCGVAFGQDQKAEPRSPAPADASVYFIGLKDGDKIPPKVTIRFGLKDMGVAPAGMEFPNSGHHHLLIDTDLPPFDQEIPSDFNHLHFGAGQTEAEITLTPGEHTLQLLFADQNHVPHNPPVFSDRIHVTVVAEQPAGASAGTEAPALPERHPAPKDASVYFITPHDGDVIPRTSIVRFGLTNMGVAPAGVDMPNTGHHHLLIDTDLPPLDQEIPSDFNHLHFGAGETEMKLTLTPGVHTLQLLFADENHVPHSPPVMSKRIEVTVRAERPRRPKRRRRNPPGMSSQPAGTVQPIETSPTLGPHRLHRTIRTNAPGRAYGASPAGGDGQASGANRTNGAGRR